MDEIVFISKMKEINGITNENFVNENEIDLTNNGTNLVDHENQNKNHSKSYRMIVSLTFHSLGIIFGDM